jgi:hypothetical protein
MNTAITTKPDQSDSRFAELIRIGNQTALGAGIHTYRVIGSSREPFNSVPETSV